ncbi:hypothetical protein SHIRM173S_07838 [Streptomyces hirsutus]
MVVRRPAFGVRAPGRRAVRYLSVASSNSRSRSASCFALSPSRSGQGLRLEREARADRLVGQVQAPLGERDLEAPAVVRVGGAAQ